ncbi:MAG: hypothetical protein HKO03_01680 [Acidimicrobiia bacterium]|nr:hypothetical protein [Acidimicrobiia bacterium]NND12644.1 hypothetical protein [Acidimicrobiia bacterium]
MTTDDCGVVGIVALMLVATALASALAVFAGSQLIVARVEAANAADAAALAAAPVTFRAFGALGSPRSEAARFARSNGARLTRCRCAVDRSMRRRTVEVEVAVVRVFWLLGTVSVHGTSRAEFDPSRLLEPGTNLPES